MESMELKVSFLSSDFEHMANQFKLLSKEFLILQQFVRQQYGSKFTAFYNQKKDGVGFGGGGGAAAATATSIPTRPEIRKPGPKSKTRGSVGNLKVEQINNYEGRNRSDNSKEDADYGDSMSDASNNADDNDFYFVSDDKANGEGDNEEDEDSCAVPTDISHLYEDDPNSGSRGKRRSIVHRYFKTVKSYEGITKSECNNCGAYVSKQAQRMRNHLMKCMQNTKIRNVAKMLKKEKESSSIIEHEFNKKGRKGDRVRLLFTKTDIGLARPQMKCKLCGTLVSNQPVRLKNHVLNRCPKRGEVNTSDYEDLPCYDDAGDGTSNEQIRKVKKLRKRKRTKEVDTDSDTSDSDAPEDEEIDEMQSESTKDPTASNSDNVPSTSGTTSNAGVGTPFLTICSNDLLEVACASHVGTT